MIQIPQYAIPLFVAPCVGDGEQVICLILGLIAGVLPKVVGNYHYSRLHIKLPTCFGEILCPDQITWLLVPRSAELIFFRLDCDRESQN
jgi:hypothetical protein